MHKLAGFFGGIMVKKYKSGQIVDMQSKMYTRVNVTHIENPSTAIVGDDFEGENLDILYFQNRCLTPLYYQELKLTTSYLYV